MFLQPEFPIAGKGGNSGREASRARGPGRRSFLGLTLRGGSVGQGHEYSGGVKSHSEKQLRPHHPPPGGGGGGGGPTQPPPQPPPPKPGGGWVIAARQRQANEAGVIVTPDSKGTDRGGGTGGLSERGRRQALAGGPGHSR